jgi:hypothetical protein
LLLLLLLQNEPMIFSPASNCTPDHMAVLHSLSTSKVALLVELPGHGLVLCPEAALTGGNAVIIGVLRSRTGPPAGSTTAAAAGVEGHARSVDAEGADATLAAGAAAAVEEMKQAGSTSDLQQQQGVVAAQPAAAVVCGAAAAAVDAPETPAAAAAAQMSAAAAEDAAAAAAAARGTAGPQAQDVQ